MPLDVSRIQAICFDVDGTLRDTDDQMVARLQGWLQPFRRFIPGGDARAFARKLVMALETPANALFGVPDRLGIDDRLAAFGDFLDEKLFTRPRRHTWLIPGARLTLEQLHPRYPLAIVSARGKRKTLLFWQNMN